MTAPCPHLTHFAMTQGHGGADDDVNATAMTMVMQMTTTLALPSHPLHNDARAWRCSVNAMAMTTAMTMTTLALPPHPLHNNTRTCQRNVGTMATMTTMTAPRPCPQPLRNNRSIAKPMWVYMWV